VRILATTSLTFLLLAAAACGGGGSSSSSNATGSPLSGNWQLNLVQQEPAPQTALSVSGFLLQSSNALSGSVQVPPVAAHNNCGGVSSLTGTINGTSVTFSVNEGGTTLSFTGTISSNNQSMSGDYQGPGGGCFTRPTSGTWNAFLVPPLNGSFTGTIDSQYMEVLQGATSAVPVMVSGTINQSTNAGTSNATLTGTITAVGYPCFTTVTLSGTISGQNVYLDIFGYNNLPIGTLGQPGTVGTTGSPATVVVNSGKVSLVDASTSGLFLGAFTGTSVAGPCPPIISGNTTQTFDSGSILFDFQ